VQGRSTATPPIPLTENHVNGKSTEGATQFSRSLRSIDLVTVRIRNGKGWKDYINRKGGKMMSIKGVPEKFYADAHVSVLFY